MIENSSKLEDGFLVADKLHADYELTQMGFYDLISTLEEAVDWINSEIHPAYRESYEVREVRAGKLVPKK